MTDSTWHREPRATTIHSARVRALYASAILGTAALAAVHLVTGLHEVVRSAPLAAVAGLVLGFLAADLVTGFVHWACDTWGSPRTPLVGAGLIHFFREHHRAPHAMLTRDWIDANGEPAAAACTALALGLLPPLHGALVEAPGVYAFLWTTVTLSACANQFHLWAHSPRPPAVVAWLQRMGCILAPGRHARHHQAPYTGTYCITSGALNPVLDALGFWRALERGVTRISGAVARAGDEPGSPER